MVIKIGGYEVLIDDEDYEKVKAIDWYTLAWKGKVYFRIQKYAGNYKRKTTFLHRVIINAPSGMEVDHINGNTLDNRKANLRVCKHSENTKNRKLNRNKTGYKGVCFRKDRRKYTARIRKDGKLYFLGYFSTPEEAYAAYCEASKKYHGEFGRIS